jgi:hypothetical protein
MLISKGRDLRSGARLTGWSTHLLPGRVSFWILLLLFRSVFTRLVTDATTLPMVQVMRSHDSWLAIALKCEVAGACDSPLRFHTCGRMTSILNAPCVTPNLCPMAYLHALFHAQFVFHLPFDCDTGPSTRTEHKSYPSFRRHRRNHFRDRRILEVCKGRRQDSVG